MFGQIKTKLSILFLFLIEASLSLSLETFAQSETPHDLINAVNGLRAFYGLEPYQIDPWLMAYAQEHSKYQAALQSGTHLHSDGRLPQDIGLLENVAGGDAGVVTVEIVVYEIWVDWGHRHILIDYSTGDIGAGIALSKNGQLYYTVDIRPGEEAVTVATRAGTSSPFVPLITSTPNENGSIIHIVSYGESLWSVAQSYGVTVDDVRRLNAIADDSTLIYAGQVLLIRQANTGTPVPPVVTSPVLTQPHVVTTTLFTEAMTPTEAAIPSPSSIVIPSLTFTIAPHDIPSDKSLKNTSMGSVVVFAIGIIGLLIAVIFGFRKSHDE